MDKQVSWNWAMYPSFQYLLLLVDRFFNTNVVMLTRRFAYEVTKRSLTDHTSTVIATISYLLVFTLC